MRDDTNLGDFLPPRVAWIIVTVAALVVVLLMADGHDQVLIGPLGRVVG